MLTNLSALPVFEAGSDAYSALGADPSATSPSPVDAAAPISSIRTQVAGVPAISRDVAGNDTPGRSADLIEAWPERGCDVGSSPAPQTVILAAGQHGRPQLSVHENLVKKGVAIAVVSAINEISLALLVPVVCALFVINIAAASVHARRTELGVLACESPRRVRRL